MKRILLLTVSAVLLMASGAGAWSINCTNGSCESSMGRVKIFWQANSMNGDIYRGQLTGCEGIPVSIEDFQSAEKKVENAFEKSVVRKKANTNEVNAKSPEETGGGPGAGTSSSGERAFTQKQTQTQEKVMGRKINVDYTLAFIKWLGDTRFSHDGPGDIGRYWHAAEYSMNAYMNGTLQAEVEGFFFQKSAGQVDNVAVDAKLNDDNREMVLTKYLGVTQYGFVLSPDDRYAMAHAQVVRLLYNKQSARDLDEVSKGFEKHMHDLKILTEGNQTALKLYRQGKKELAWAKWAADTVPYYKRFVDTKDKYIAALEVWDSTDQQWHADEMKSIENSVAAKDHSLEIVTFVGPIIPYPVIFGLLGLVVVGGGVVFISKKKAKKPEAGE